MRLKRFYYSLSSLLMLIRKDIRSRFPMSIFEKCALWRKGFLSEKQVLYQFNKNDYRLFLSDYHTSQARWIDEPYCDVLTNKYIFARVMDGVIETPRIHAVIFHDDFIPQPGEDRVEDFNSMISLCERKGALVIKPVTGGGGRGVYTMRVDSGIIYLNNRQVTESETRQIVRSVSHAIVTEFVEQAGYARMLHPGSTNTLRILTLFDWETSRPFIARAVQRIGNKKSAPQDNFTRGGLSAMVDPETGCLGKAASHPVTRELTWHEVHPDTGTQITGTCIPGWKDIEATLLEAASRIRFIPCIGWDIVVTGDGVKAIEGNHHPDPDVLQCHGPLLTDPRIRMFYRKYGIIR